MTYHLLAGGTGETQVQPEATPTKEATQQHKEATPTETDVSVKIVETLPHEGSKVAITSPPDEAILPSAVEKAPPPAPAQEDTDQGQEEKENSGVS